VRPIAEGLIGRLSAAAQSDLSSPAQAERVAVGIVNGEIAFDTNGAVVKNCDFCGHYFDRTTLPLQFRF
jgi:hypothetical protein